MYIWINTAPMILGWLGASCLGRPPPPALPRAAARAYVFIHSGLHRARCFNVWENVGQSSRLRARRCLTSENNQWLCERKYATGEHPGPIV